MEKEIDNILGMFEMGCYSQEEAKQKLLNLHSVSTRTCTDALNTIIKWNEYDKNGTDNRASHKDECIDVICRATLKALDQYGC